MNCSKCNTPHPPCEMVPYCDPFPLCLSCLEKDRDRYRLAWLEVCGERDQLQSDYDEAIDVLQWTRITAANKAKELKDKIAELESKIKDLELEELT